MRLDDAFAGDAEAGAGTGAGTGANVKPPEGVAAGAGAGAAKEKPVVGAAEVALAVAGAANEKPPDGAAAGTELEAGAENVNPPLAGVVDAAGAPNVKPVATTGAAATTGALPNEKVAGLLSLLAATIAAVVPLPNVKPDDVIVEVGAADTAGVVAIPVPVLPPGLSALQQLHLAAMSGLLTMHTAHFQPPAAIDDANGFEREEEGAATSSSSLS